MPFDAVPAHVKGWIEVSDQGAALVLRIGGELDAASRLAIEPAVLTAIDSTGSVVIDLSDLTFCDSSGLAMFIAAYSKASDVKATLTIRQIRPAVRRLFEITGLEHLIEPIEPVEPIE